MSGRVRLGWRSGPNAGSPPLAIAVLDAAGEVITLRRGDGGIPMTSRIAEDEEAVRTAVERWREQRLSADREPR